MNRRSKPLWRVSSTSDFIRYARLSVLVQHTPKLQEWSDATEEEANRLYWAVLPDDSELVARFERKFRDNPADF